MTECFSTETVRDEVLDSGHLGGDVCAKMIFTHPLPLRDLSVILDNKTLIQSHNNNLKSSLIPNGAIRSITNDS